MYVCYVYAPVYAGLTLYHRNLSGLRTGILVFSWALWYMCIVPEPRRLMQENCELETSMGYTVKNLLEVGVAEV